MIAIKIITQGSTDHLLSLIATHRYRGPFRNDIWSCFAPPEICLL